MPELFANPLLRTDRLSVVDATVIDAPTVHIRTKRSAIREIRDTRRSKTAQEAIAGLTRDVELCGFTKGQFSLLDLLKAIAEITGPAALTLSTWTANGPEIGTLADMVADGRLSSARFLIDASFARRDPQAAEQLRKRFGLNAVRVSQTHSKFALYENADWKLVLRTSMNLNMNPRFEDFTVAHDPELFEFMSTVMRELWERQREGITMAPGDRGHVGRTFSADL
jgi:hypothetical protein